MQNTLSTEENTLQKPFTKFTKDASQKYKTVRNNYYNYHAREIPFCRAHYFKRLTYAYLGSN